MSICLYVFKKYVQNAIIQQKDISQNKRNMWTKWFTKEYVRNYVLYLFVIQCNITSLISKVIWKTISIINLPVL